MEAYKEMKKRLLNAFLLFIVFSVILLSFFTLFIQ